MFHLCAGARQMYEDYKATGALLITVRICIAVQVLPLQCGNTAHAAR